MESIKMSNNKWEVLKQMRYRKTLKFWDLPWPHDTSLYYEGEEALVLARLWKDWEGLTFP